MSVVRHSEILIYADDVKIFKRINDSNDCSLLQSDLSAFSVWCRNNYLYLNIDKCNVVTFCRKLLPLSFPYSIDTALLNVTSEIKDLGIIFDSKLTFAQHLDFITNKASSMLGFVRRWSKEFHDPYALRSLYECLVRSILEYGCQVWYPFYNVHINRLESVQNKFLRFALRRLPWSNRFELPPYENRLNLLNMTSLHKRRDYHLCLFLHKVLIGLMDSPEILAAISINASSRVLRSRALLQIRFHRTNYGSFEPLSNMCRCYNKYSQFIDFNVELQQVKSILLSCS